MLKLLVGPVHSGKTGVVFDCIREDAAAGRRSVLLVPEQTSFAYEKRAASLGLPEVEAMSFSRLAELALARHGGDDRRRMTNTSAFFLMNLALEEVADALTLYSGQSKTRGFLEQLVRFAAECADAGITPEGLSAFALSQKKGTLRDKLCDLSLVLDAYSAVVHREHIGDADVMTMAAERLTGADDFANAGIYIESFSSFTAPEYRLISALLPQAHCVSVSLIGDGKPDTPAYASTRETEKRLLRIADSCSVGVKKHVLTERKTGIPESFLDAVAAGDIPQDAAEYGSIGAYLAPDPAAEADYVAAKCAELVYEQGLRCREIAIVMRDDARYRTVLPEALSRAGLVYFTDMRAQDRTDVLLRGVTDAVLAAAGDRRGDMMSAAKSPLFGLDPAALGETENYVSVWGVRNADWFFEFRNNPDGLREDATPEQTERLFRINACREAVAGPVAALRAAIQSGSGVIFAQAVYKFLEDISAAEHLEAFAAAMPEQSSRMFLQQQSQLWDQLMEILDLFANVPEEIVLTPARITELTALAFSSCEVATPPQTLDGITVGTADRMRIDDARAVFLMGAVEGEFPRVSVPAGLLSDDERRRLVDGGMSLLADFDNLERQERLLCHTVASAAREQLFVTAPRAELTGEELAPSELYAAAERFSGPQSDPVGAISPAWALREYAAGDPADKATQTLRRALVLAGQGEALDRIDRASGKSPHRIESAPIARRLFGENMYISPSRLEKYYKCPYAYFAGSGMGVQALRRAELSPVESGTLIHRVLEQVVSEHGGKGLANVPDCDLRTEIRKVISEYFAAAVSDPAALTARMRAGLERIGDWLFELLRRLGDEFAQSEFEPVGFEMPVGFGETIGGLRLKTADGCNIEVHGTIDRVDVADIGGKRYVRVVDYKSGGKKFLLSDVFYGLNLQMLIYLFSVWKNGHGPYSGVLPAGVLYMPALGKYTNGDRDAGNDTLTAQYRMNGLLLRDREVLRAMEPDGEGIFIPVKAGEEDKSASLATLSELGHLCALIENKISGMAERLHAGEIAAFPIAGERTPCKYCDYRLICGHEEGDPEQELLTVDRDLILGEGDDTDETDE